MQLLTIVIFCIFWGEKIFGVKFPKKDHRKYSMLKLCQDSLAVQWLRLHLLMQGVWVLSLAGELRIHILEAKTQNINNKSNIVTNSIKIFKMALIKKKKKKIER